jgi:hypothetical protein
MYLNKSKKAWGEWINLKGIVLINPIIDPIEQRNHSIEYAEFKKLVTDVQAFFMGYPEKWCRESLENKDMWKAYLTCGMSDAFPIGNPLYPIFDTRNIHK